MTCAPCASIQTGRQCPGDGAPLEGEAALRPVGFKLPGAQSSRWVPGGGFCLGRLWFSAVCGARAAEARRHRVGASGRSGRRATVRSLLYMWTVVGLSIKHSVRASWGCFCQIENARPSPPTWRGSHRLPACAITSCTPVGDLGPRAPHSSAEPETLPPLLPQGVQGALSLGEDALRGVL